MSLGANLSTYLKVALNADKHVAEWLHTIDVPVFVTAGLKVGSHRRPKSDAFEVLPKATLRS